jgi:hypothetical protein
MPPLICEKCRREIKPGEDVSFVGMDYDELVERRIMLSEEAIVVHASCAKEADDGAA